MKHFCNGAGWAERGAFVGHFALAMFVMFAAAGCASTQSFSRFDAREGDNGLSMDHKSRILLMEPDIELSELTAAGLEEPKADWTLRGRKNVDLALEDFFAAGSVRLVRYRPPAGNPDIERRDDQLVKLHERVGSSILMHLYGSAATLPGKGGKLDWTLGAGTADLGVEQRADYALFVYIRDSYATAGRVATMVVMALIGVDVQGGIQVGFVSLVDLKTGDVVWFNRLVSETGDLREREPAAKAVDKLLAGFPS